jgi:hypothetical protein
VSFADTIGAAGALGGAIGVTLPLAADTGLVPMLLLAVTVNVYGVPLVRPVTVVVLLSPPTVLVWPPELVTVWLMIGLPPSAEAVHDTRAEPSPLVAETRVGADGGLGGATGTTLELAAELGLVPVALAAVTVKV